MLIRPFKNHLPRVAARVYIDVAAVVIGDVTLGADSSVWPCAALASAPIFKMVRYYMSRIKQQVTPMVFP